jgi:DNA invertase Pin-like site-specific DNA recombinase
VNAGLRRAKAAGKTLGRRKLEDEKDTERRAVAEALRANLREGGVGIRKLAAIHGVGVGTVLRIKADMQRQLGAH